MKRTIFILLAAPLLFTACFGRPAPQRNSLPVTIYGVQPGRPAVVAFSALWCHPCREEIETLNLAAREFGDQIQIVGLLVEGDQKGAPVQEADKANFKSFAGVGPEFPIRTDSQWKLFDASRAPNGRALPTLLIINRSGQTQQIVQQSLDYRSQLRPLLLAVLQGENIPPVEQKPVEVPGVKMEDTVANWLARAEVSARPEFLTNLTAGWDKGLAQNGFTREEMPLDTGKINFVWDEASGVNTPQKAAWYAETINGICNLQLVLAPDATLISSSGSCRPR